MRLTHALLSESIFRHPVFNLGFRPFFLLAGVFATLIIPLWLAILTGLWPAPPYLGPVGWHAHEMLFGYTMAVVAGFLLTAVRNWTGLPTPTGPLLAGLALLWLTARVALISTAVVPAWLAAAIDVAFLPLIAGVLLPPLWRSRNRPNLVFPFILLALAGANVVMHLQALGVLVSGSGHALQFSLNVVTLIMIVMGGARDSRIYRKCVAQGPGSSPCLGGCYRYRSSHPGAGDRSLPVLAGHGRAGGVTGGGGEPHPYVALAISCHTASADAVDSAPRLCLDCRCPCPERTRRYGTGGNAQCGHSCVDRWRDRQSDVGHDESRGAGSHRPRYRGVNYHNGRICSHQRWRSDTCNDTSRSTRILLTWAHRIRTVMVSGLRAVCHPLHPYSDATPHRREAGLSVCQRF